jgi:hypothetical protein
MLSISLTMIHIANYRSTTQGWMNLVLASADTSPAVASVTTSKLLTEVCHGFLLPVPSVDIPNLSSWWLWMLLPSGYLT